MFENLKIWKFVPFCQEPLGWSFLLKLFSSISLPPQLIGPLPINTNPRVSGGARFNELVRSSIFNSKKHLISLLSGVYFRGLYQLCRWNWTVMDIEPFNAACFILMVVVKCCNIKLLHMVSGTCSHQEIKELWRNPQEPFMIRVLGTAGKPTARRNGAVERTEQHGRRHPQQHDEHFA